MNSNKSIIFKFYLPLLWISQPFLPCLPQLPKWSYLTIVGNKSSTNSIVKNTSDNKTLNNIWTCSIVNLPTSSPFTIKKLSSFSKKYRNSNQTLTNFPSKKLIMIPNSKRKSAKSKIFSLNKSKNKNNKELKRWNNGSSSQTKNLLKSAIRSKK